MQSGMSQKAPYPSKNTDSISQSRQAPLVYPPTVMREGAGEGK